jgi:hypothetical protein
LVRANGRQKKQIARPKKLKGLKTMGRKRTIVWMVLGIAGAVTALLLIGVHHWRPRWSIIQGAVIRRDTDPHKETPIANALVIAKYGNSTLTTHSDASGYFRIAFPGAVLPGQAVKLSFQSPNFDPLDIEVTIRFRSSLRQLIVAAMTPSTEPEVFAASATPTVVQNLRVRYTINSENAVNIGSAAKTFEIMNTGNVPCKRQPVCSPDGYWKAASASIEMDAGAGNEFRDARASCIAGPCPFTKIDSTGFANGGQLITASAIDWSNPATFLLQAEVFHTSVISNVRELYPIFFGRSLNFSIPPTAEGVTLVAELNGQQIVFPIGPDLYLSWAACTVRASASAEKSEIYQCELKPGFRF